MNSSKSDALPCLRQKQALLLKAVVLSTVVLSTLVTPAFSQAQTKPKNPLTPKFLIGDAVSLSNQDYPEIEKAIQRFRNSDFTGALEYLKAAKEKYPKLAPPDVMMARMQMLARNGRAVQLFLERAVVLHPEDPEAYLMLADGAFASQRTAEALALFDYAAPLADGFKGNNKRKRSFQVKVIAGRAAVAERRAQWEQAAGLLKKWIEMDPEKAAAHSRLGIVLFRLDKAQESLAEFKKAREINPAVSHPFVTLGQLFSGGGDIEKARKSFEKAYSENKADVKVAQSYAEWLIQQGELSKAEEVAAALRKDEPDSIDALLLNGLVFYMQGQSDRAEQALQKVLSLDPRNAGATDLLAMLLIQNENNDDKQRALQYAQMNAERLANNSQIIITRAYVLYELGRKAEAQKSLSKLGKSSIKPDSTYLIAKMFAAEGQNEKALQMLDKIVSQKTGLVIFRREAEELLKQVKEAVGDALPPQ